MNCLEPSGAVSALWIVKLVIGLAVEVNKVVVDLRYASDVPNSKTQEPRRIARFEFTDFRGFKNLRPEIHKYLKANEKKRAADPSGLAYLADVVSCWRRRTRSVFRPDNPACVSRSHRRLLAGRILCSQLRPLRLRVSGAPSKLG